MKLYRDVYQSPPLTHEQLDRINEQTFLKTQRENDMLRKRLTNMRYALIAAQQFIEQAYGINPGAMHGDPTLAEVRRALEQK